MYRDCLQPAESSVESIVRFPRISNLLSFVGKYTCAGSKGQILRSERLSRELSASEAAITFHEIEVNRC